MDYCFNGGCWGAVFAVPQSVVDNYIKLANEASLKVLLFVLRSSGTKFSSGEIASALNLKENQVDEAFIFWENANIFSPAEHHETVGTQNESAMEKKTAPDEVTVTKSSIPSGTDYNIKPSEIAERIKASEDVKVMFSMAENSFGRPLNHTEQRTLIWIHDYLGLPADVIITIIAFCVSMEKGNIKYIETTAADWAERGINTLKQAQEEIRIQENKHTYTGKIMKIFGITRRLTSKQQEFIDSWSGRGYSFELIEYAYEKTIDNIDKLNFPYINKILENWYENGLTDRAKVDSEKRSPGKKGEETEAHSYNLDDYKSLVNNFGDKK